MEKCGASITHKIVNHPDFPELSKISKFSHTTGIAKAVQKVDWARIMNSIQILCYS
jgi:hypothetical protein